MWRELVLSSTASAMARENAGTAGSILEGICTVRVTTCCSGVRVVGERGTWSGTFLVTAARHGSSRGASRWDLDVGHRHSGRRTPLGLGYGSNGRRQAPTRVVGGCLSHEKVFVFAPSHHVSCQSFCPNSKIMPEPADAKHTATTTTHWSVIAVLARRVRSIRCTEVLQAGTKGVDKVECQSVSGRDFNVRARGVNCNCNPASFQSASFLIWMSISVVVNESRHSPFQSFVF